ncbi:uncharacterized protein Z518_01920 [Rhinocladiella mackenziei CBS 650.93]|uniref:Rhinocladiella mackenziei CBS 650.93 unplaced genomic scaffold supercont1.2, whole genome shotgun sequence n=1 Tax=Rhinocladiella mackenziei CBS 650.93 TaxID=1442369 RepID=A0A0D2FY87_9EURO|nr:uncharacterized protein Z518_01920 [Rhinocladiella mackenziei CBS 650.93]KIX07267.1 hypothetical protein Z518_01920 [Rhinocladiella mackenziei CBS 650.93]
MPGPRFENKIILVTGGASGLGAAACDLFVSEGGTVFIMDLDEKSVLSQLPGDKAHFFRGDVSKPEDCEAAINTCVEKLGRLDVLFHNAARPAPMTTVPYHDLALFQQIINTNLCSLFYLARIAIPQMQKQGKGVIVATASSSALAGEYGLASYSASKAGMLNLMRTMALDHAKDNIRINAICPGYMPTPMTEGLGELVKVVEDSIPQGRGGDPKEVAQTALFLASEDASYMTGQALVVDGGWSAHSGAPNLLKYVPQQFRYDEK